MSTTKTGLVPQEDQGVIMVNVSISPGSTLEETTKVMDRLENILKDTPEIEHYARRSRIWTDIRSGNFVRYDHYPPERLERTKGQGA